MTEKERERVGNVVGARAVHSCASWAHRDRSTSDWKKCLYCFVIPNEWSSSTSTAATKFSSFGLFSRPLLLVCQSSSCGLAVVKLSQATDQPLRQSEFKETLNAVTTLVFAFIMKPRFVVKVNLNWCYCQRWRDEVSILSEQREPKPVHDVVRQCLCPNFCIPHICICARRLAVFLRSIPEVVLHMERHRRAGVLDGQQKWCLIVHRRRRLLRLLWAEAGGRKLKAQVQPWWRHKGPLGGKRPLRWKSVA